MMEHYSLLTQVVEVITFIKLNEPIGEILYCDQEIGNCSDPCAVAVKRAIPWRHLTNIILFWMKLDRHKSISGK